MLLIGLADVLPAEEAEPAEEMTMDAFAAIRNNLRSAIPGKSNPPTSGVSKSSAPYSSPAKTASNPFLAAAPEPTEPTEPTAPANSVCASIDPFVLVLH